IKESPDTLSENALVNQGTTRMGAIGNYLATDHRHCDGLFARAEEAASAGDWPGCASAFDGFRHALEHHFSMEERVLFPVFEERTGMAGGPTVVMRGEHQQMRGLCALLAEAAQGRSAEEFLGHCESLLILMQQHNLKEENVLYPMADRALDAGGAELVARMGAIPEGV
ncbi:MAG TPA: hemerythrin domain-containing protein, partial [Burkholderiales bacterium]